MQLVELQKNKALLDDFPGDVYALSASSPEIHTDLKKELGVDLPILSDKYLTLIEKANLKDPKERKAMRGFAILDKDGKVIDSQQFDPFGEQISEIIQNATEKISQQ
jgi:peroxiredoxin